jgi:CIC family chloride channel protein
MRPLDHDRPDDSEALLTLVDQGIYLEMNATLERAMPIFERTGLDIIPVVTLAPGDAPPALEGALFQVDALKAYNRALAATAEEEHS